MINKTLVTDSIFTIPLDRKRNDQTHVFFKPACFTRLFPPALPHPVSEPLSECIPTSLSSPPIAPPNVIVKDLLVCTRLLARYAAKDSTFTSTHALPRPLPLRLFPKASSSSFYSPPVASFNIIVNVLLIGFGHYPQSAAEDSCTCCEKLFIHVYSQKLRRGSLYFLWSLILSYFSLRRTNRWGRLTLSMHVLSLLPPLLTERTTKSDKLKVILKVRTPTRMIFGF